MSRHRGFSKTGWETVIRQGCSRTTIASSITVRWNGQVIWRTSKAVQSTCSKQLARSSINRRATLSSTLRALCFAWSRTVWTCRKWRQEKFVAVVRRCQFSLSYRTTRRMGWTTTRMSHPIFAKINCCGRWTRRQVVWTQMFRMSNRSRRLPRAQTSPTPPPSSVITCKMALLK